MNFWKVCLLLSFQSTCFQSRKAQTLSDQLDTICNHFRSIRSCSSRVLAIVEDVQQLAQTHSHLVRLDTNFVRPCIEQLFQLLYGACGRFKDCVCEEDLLGYCPRLSSLSQNIFDELVQELIKEESLSYKKLKVGLLKFTVVENRLSQSKTLFHNVFLMSRELFNLSKSI